MKPSYLTHTQTRPYELEPWQSNSHIKNQSLPLRKEKIQTSTSQHPNPQHASSGAGQGGPSARTLAARTDTLARCRRTHALQAACGSSRVSSDLWKRQTLCRSLCRCDLWGRASEYGGCEGLTSACWVYSRTTLLCWSGIGRTYSRSDLEVKVLLQFSQASVATDLEREREVLRLVGVVAGGARVPKLVRSETL